MENRTTRGPPKVARKWNRNVYPQRTKTVKGRKLKLCVVESAVDLETKYRQGRKDWGKGGG